MEKNIYRVGVILLSAVMLCACEGNGNKSRGSIEDTDREDPTVTAADPTPTPIDEPNVDPPYVKEDGEWAEYFANGEVENNGSYLVRVGNRVYFRVYDTRAVDRTRLGTDFLVEDNDLYESEIRYYDLDTGKVGVLGKVNGRGKMYATEYGMLIAGGVHTADLLKPDGTVETDYYNGNPIGVSDDGSYIALELESGFDLTYQPIVMMKDDQELCRLAGDEDLYATFSGFVGNSMVGTVYNNGSCSCVAATADGENIYIGDISSYQGEFYELSPEEYDFISDGEDFVVLYGYYDGGTYSLQASKCFCGCIEENSLVCDETIEDIYERHLYIDEFGNIQTGIHAPNEVGLSERWQGDLVYYTDSENYDTVCENCILWPEEDYAFAMYNFFQTGYKVGDKVFTIKAEAGRNKYANYSSTLAYNLYAISYYVYDLNEDGKFTVLEDLYSTSWSEGKYTLEDLEGEWYCDKIVAEGEEINPGDYGESYRLIFDGENVTLRFEYNGEEDDILAVWQPGEEFYIDGCYFAVPDDPAEQTINVICYNHNMIEIRFSYVFDGGTPEAWYGYFMRNK